MKFRPHRHKLPELKRKLLLVTGLTVFLVLAGISTAFLKTHPDSLSGFINRQDHQPKKELKNYRGKIYDRNFRELAGSYQTCAVYARPLEIENTEFVADRLTQTLDLDKAKLLSDLKSERGFVWLIEALDTESASIISDLNLKGIYVTDKTRRLYSNNKTAAHILGFTENEQGLDGVELQYNSILKGDTLQTIDLPMIEVEENNGLPKGAELILTLDLKIQNILESNLSKVMKKNGATSAKAIIMDPNNGAILAMASLPSYDPNRYWEYSAGERSNRAINELLFTKGLDGFINSVIQKEAILKELPSKKNRKDKPSEYIVLAPRKIKKKITDRRAAFYAENLQDKVVSFAGNSKFNIDLPAGTDSSDSSYSTSFWVDTLKHSSALQLLSDFAILINSGKNVGPHMLAGILDKSTGQTLQTKFSKLNRTILDNESGESALNFITELGTAGPKKSFFLEAILEHEPAKTSQTEADSQNQKVKDFQESKYNSVMLAAIPSEKPELIMITAFDGLNVQRNKGAKFKSPSLNIGKKILPKVLPLSQTKIVSANQPVGDMENAAILEASLHKIKAKRKAGNKLVQKDKPVNFKMPDVTGKSLRGALQSLQQYSLTININGSGKITEQYPEAGTTTVSGQSCSLKLKTQTKFQPAH